jgi:hypothetical protein
MNKWTTLAAAAAISIGSYAWAAEPIGDKVDRAADNTKEAAKDAKANWDHGRIYTMLSQVTEAGLTKGGFDDLVERFNDADRNRIGKWVSDNNNKAALDKLDGAIDQFRRDWKAKYNNDFDIKKDDVVFGNAPFTVARGEIGKDAELAGKKLPAAEDNKPGGGDKNLDTGRNVAVLTVAASHGLPELKVPLIHELPDNWKIDVPDEIDGQKLYDNISKHLYMAGQDKANWPADENEAYRTVAHHILMGVMGVEKTDVGDRAKDLK